MSCKKCYKDSGEFCESDCVDDFLKTEKKKIKELIKKNPKHKKKLEKIYKKLLK